MKLFPAKCQERVTLRKLRRQTGNSSFLPAKCWPLLHVSRRISARFSTFAFVCLFFCYITNRLMTSPLGNSEFCFPRISMFPSTSSRGFSGNKILSYISYGLTAWGLASKSYLTKILVLKKRALRFIFSVERCEHAVPLFIHAVFFFFTSKIPSNILNLLSDTTSIHSYNTRSSLANKFYITKSRLEIQKELSQE